MPDREIDGLLGMLPRTADRRWTDLVGDLDDPGAEKIRDCLKLCLRLGEILIRDTYTVRESTVTSLSDALANQLREWSEEGWEPLKDYVLSLMIAGATLAAVITEAGDRSNPDRVNGEVRKVAYGMARKVGDGS